MARPKKNVEEVKEIKRKGRPKKVEPTLEERVRVLEDAYDKLATHIKDIDMDLNEMFCDCCEECEKEAVEEEHNEWDELLKLLEEKVDKSENKKRPINITIRTSYSKPFNFDDTWLFF